HSVTILPVRGKILSTKQWLCKKLHSNAKYHNARFLHFTVQRIPRDSKSEPHIPLWPFLREAVSQCYPTLILAERQQAFSRQNSLRELRRYLVGYVENGW